MAIYSKTCHIYPKYECILPESIKNIPQGLKSFLWFLNVLWLQNKLLDLQNKKALTFWDIVKLKGFRKKPNFKRTKISGSLPKLTCNGI